MLAGNDVSRWQGVIDFNTYRHHSHFIIMKTSEGIGFKDPMFTRNQSESRRVGLDLGYYHFARPDLGNSGEAEAGWFLKAIGGLQKNEVVALDYEPASNPFPVVDWCKRFLDRMQQETGMKPYIYLNKSQVRGFNWKPIAQAGYPLWLASYDGNVISGDWDFVAMQQWTSSQRVTGINGNVDGCHFFGTVEQFRAYGFKTPAQPSASKSPSSSISRSKSPSSSPSPSKSPSPSQSPSASPSPSDSDPIDECAIQNQMIDDIDEVLRSNWWWFGRNSWKNKRQELWDILMSEMNREDNE